MCYVFNKLKFILYEKFSLYSEQIKYETKLEIDLREMFELFSQLEQIFNFKIDFDEIYYLLKRTKF